MNLKQACEDWIGEERSTERLTSKALIDARLSQNQVRAELRASLPSLLAKIEQHVLEAYESGVNTGHLAEAEYQGRKELEARKDELETMLKPVKCYRPFCKQEHTLVRKRYVKDRIKELDALLNTKGGK